MASELAKWLAGQIMPRYGCEYGSSEELAEDIDRELEPYLAVVEAAKRFIDRGSTGTMMKLEQSLDALASHSGQKEGGE